MLSLDSQRVNFNIVISDLSRCENTVGEILDGISSLGLIYFACVHDKDKHEDGTPKLNHLHVVIMSMKRMRVKQVINMFVDLAKTNFENVRVEEVVSVCGSVQYLLHISDVNKYQYSREELRTNQPTQADAYLIETPKAQELTTQQLFDLIFKDNLSRIELIYAIGIGKYQHYRHTIEDLYMYAHKRKNI